MGRGIAASLLTAAALVGSSFQQEVPATRDFFQVGGGYVPSKSQKGEQVLQDQIFVEHLIPLEGPSQAFPLVFLHDLGQSGASWLNKPDGTRGWASLFIAQGWELYLVDAPSVGRSVWNPDSAVRPSPLVTAEWVMKYWTASHEYKLWPQAGGHMQWPGTGHVGDHAFDRFFSSQLAFPDNVTYIQSSAQAAGAALLDYINKPAVVVGHGASGPIPALLADVRPDLVAGLILLEPLGPPFYNPQPIDKITLGSVRPWGPSDIPISWDPPVANPKNDLQTVMSPPAAPDMFGCTLQVDNATVKPRKLKYLVNKPILIVTGESSYNARYDHCTHQFYEQAGAGPVEHVQLGKAGIHGNGHMFFLEKNSDQIQGVLRDWLAKLKS